MRRSFWKTHIEEHLLYGDSRAAVVVSISPLLVAAYTDELDCVAVLRFDDSFVKEYGLQVGSRLLTVNTYFYLTGSYEQDLEVGPDASGQYGNFAPFIADFLTDNVDSLEPRKAEISKGEWRRTAELGKRYLAGNNARARDGRPLLSSFPAKAPGHDSLPNLHASHPADVSGKRSNTHFPVSEALKNVLALMVFIMLAVSCKRLIVLNPRAGWFGVILFGAMSVLTVVNIVRISGADKTRSAHAGEGRSRSALLRTGTVAVALFLGVADKFISELMLGSSHRLWAFFGTFVTTLAFYPLRGDQEKDLPNFPIWAVYCALMGLVSVAFSYLRDRIG